MGTSQRMAACAVGGTLALLLCVLLAAPAGVGAKVQELWFTISTIEIDPACMGFRPTIVVNGQFPGPTIYADEGDTLIVHVINKQALPVSLHWHELANHDAQWYDGVPGITQCPIKQGQNYTQIMQIFGQWGTFWYHAHTNQMRNTAHGAVIVRGPRDTNAEPLPVKISDDLLILGGDWYQRTAQELDDTILKVPFVGFPVPDTLHINGFTLCGTPKVFNVRINRWYRIRVINTALWAALQLKIENHTFIVHEAEGGFIMHQRRDALDVYPGQSYSVLLFTNKRPDNYWIVMNSRYDVEKTLKNPAVAVLSYDGVGTAPTEINRPWPKGPSDSEKLLYGPKQQASLQSPYYNQALESAQISKLIVLEMNQHSPNNSLQVFSMNNVSFVFKNSVPFLLADYSGTSDQVYNSTILPDVAPDGVTSYRGDAVKYSPYVITIPYGAWVQLVFQNHLPPGGMHPFHVHGQNFFVVGQGTGRFKASRWKKYKYNLVNPVLRNTVPVFEGMWTAVRFRATNPGQWIVHCHLEQHADQGLLAILKVLWPAPDGTQNGPKPLGPPPADYPECSA